MRETYTNKWLVEEDNTIDDTYDVKAHLLEIHSGELNSILTKDLRLAYFKTEEDRKFVVDLLSKAFEALHIIKDKEQAKYASKRLAIEAQGLINTNINVIHNPLLKLLLEEMPQPMEPPKEMDIDKATIDKIKGVKPQ